MTPEPKASASDLDAAVERAWQMMVDCEAEPDLPLMVDAHVCAEHAADIRLILSALSSKSQAAEGMAKALIETVEHFERVDGDERHKAVIANATAAYTHYRTLGDRHVD